MSDKRTLRSKLLATRLELPNTEALALSMQIQKNLRLVIGAAARNFETVHAYSPLDLLHEVDIAPAISRLAKSYAWQTIHTTNKVGAAWTTMEWNSDHEIAPLATYDLIVVPMLGFDNRLHRIGYGGGYYDRFLSQQHVAFKVGICFEQGHVARIPVEIHDVPLDVIVTEKSIYESTV